MSRDFFDELSASLKEAVSLAKGADTSPAAETLPRQDASQDRTDARHECALDKLLGASARTNMERWILGAEPGGGGLVLASFDNCCKTISFF